METSLPMADDVADFPVPHYSRKSVARAGKVLGGPILWDEARREEYYQAFRTAYDWRASHAYPMRSIRWEVREKVRRLKARGVTAARLKRMSSIRKKLGRLRETLPQIQDIGGSRIIVEASESLGELIRQYRSGECAHHVRTDTSYIENPRATGYRSHHFVFDFRPHNEDEAPFEGRRIELQLRTRLQHAWATAVETVGLVRREDMKAGEGDPRWLRFFELVSSEFAEFEVCPLVPGAPAKHERVKEIVELDRELDAINRLETINQAFYFTEHNISRGARYFLMQYDIAAGHLLVTGYQQPVRATEYYGRFEENAAINSVLVDVDTLEELKAAYPNYFLDVRLFTENVVKITRGDDALTTVLKKADLKRTAHGFDLDWLKKWLPPDEK